MGRINFGFAPKSGVGKLNFRPGHVFAPQFDKAVAAIKVNKGGLKKPRIKTGFKMPKGGLE